MNRHTISIFVLRSMVCALFVLVTGQSAATLITWTNTAGGTWSTAANWNPNQVPLASDDVLIISNGTYSVAVDTAVTINTLVLGATNGNQTLYDPSFSLTLNNASSINTNGIFWLAGGTLTASNLTVQGRMNWDAGMVTIGGALALTPNGILNLTNASTCYFSGVVTNNGTIVMGATNGALTLYGYDPVRIYNNGLWLSQSDHSRQFLNADGLTNKWFFNTGTFRQTGSGTTTVGWPFTTTGTFDQQGGLLSVSTWVGASVLHGTPTFNNTIGSAGATVTVSSSAILNIVSGATLNGALTVDAGGMLSLTNTGTCYLYGLLTNNGTVVMGGADGSVTLYGYDPMRAYNNSLWISQSNFARQFINADGLTNKLFVNSGTFRQTGNGTTLFGWPFTTTGSFDCQGGLLDVQTWIGANILRGNPIFNNQIGSAGASVNVATNATVRSVSNGSLYGAVTVDLGGSLYLTNSGTYTLHGILTNNGTVTMGGTDGSVALYGYDPDRAYNNGLWISQSDYNRQFINADGLTNKSFLNTGTFRQTGNGTTLFSWPFTTTGTIDQQGGLLDVQVWLGSSVLRNILVFNNQIGSADATVNVANNAAVRSVSNGSLYGAVTIDLGGTLYLTNSGTYTLHGILTNNGTVTMGGTDGSVALYGYDPDRAYNNGLWISQSDYNRQFINADGLTNKLFLNTGTFRQTGNGTTLFGWPYTSSGTADIQSGSMSMGDLFSQTAGTTLLDGGNLSSTQPFLLLGGQLTGTNTVTASVTNNGVVSPGLPTGKLSIVGNYNQTTNGTLQIELGGNTPGVNFDQLSVSGTAHYGGTLVVSLTNAFVPSSNTTFIVITGGPKVSTFDHFYYPSNLIGMQVIYTGTVTSLLASNAPPRFDPYIQNGNFIAHFYGIPGTNYTIQWTAELPTTNWQKLTNVIAPPADFGLGTGVVELVDPVTISNRFYRTVTPAY